MSPTITTAKAYYRIATKFVECETNINTLVPLDVNICKVATVTVVKEVYAQ